MCTTVSSQFYKMWLQNEFTLLHRDATKIWHNQQNAFNNILFSSSAGWKLYCLYFLAYLQMVSLLPRISYPWSYLEYLHDIQDNSKIKVIQWRCQSFGHEMLVQVNLISSKVLLARFEAGKQWKMKTNSRVSCGKSVNSLLKEWLHNAQ